MHAPRDGRGFVPFDFIEATRTNAPEQERGPAFCEELPKNPLKVLASSVWEAAAELAVNLIGTICSIRSCRITDTTVIGARSPLECIYG